MFTMSTTRLALATTVAFATLFGCATPMANSVKAPGVQQDANADTASSFQAEQADERDMDDYGLTADDASAGRYALMAKDDARPTATTTATAKADAQAQADAKASADATLQADGKAAKEAAAQARDAAKQAADQARDAAKQAKEAARDAAKAAREAFKAQLQAAVKAKVEAHAAQQKAKAKERQAAHKDEHDAIAKAAKGTPWVDNGDGTRSKTFESDVTRTVNGETMTRHVKMVRTQNADGELVADHTEFSETMPGGQSKSSVRDKSLQADGSYKVTYHAEMTFKDGTKRVADWTKTISADGGVSGTGTITWTDKDVKTTKSVTITLGGKDDDETATTGSPAPSASPAASTDPAASGSPAASASPAASTAPAASTSPAASTDPAASTAPAASTSPAASAAPTATPSPAAS